MAKLSGVFLLLALVGCSGFAGADVRSQEGATPCASGENSYECQVIRYRNAT